MTTLLLPIQMLVLVALAVGCARPGLRGPAGVFALLAGLVAVATAALAEGDATLAVDHRFLAYVGLELQTKSFPIENVTVSAWIWPLVAGGFCLAWGALLLVWRRPASPFGAPLILAWSSCAVLLLLEKTAAPAALLAPFDLAPERALLPASLAVVWILAARGGRFLPLVFYLVLFFAATRLPLALFGALATQNEWGTHLDVHATLFIALRDQPVELVAGSWTQIAWLIWVPQLVIYPMVYLFSLGGILFFGHMLRRQREHDARGATAALGVLLALAVGLPAQDSKPVASSDPIARLAAQARTDKRDILLVFTSKESAWSRRLHEEVLNKKAFSGPIGQDFVLRIVRANETDWNGVRQRFDVDSYPTIVLLDSQGRRFARTSYRTGGPLLYRTHLQSLRRIRTHRDDLLSQAAKATDLARARLLAAAMDALPEDLCRGDYRPTLQEIVKLDATGRAELRNRFQAALVELDQQQALRELRRATDALAAQKDWAGIRRLTTAYLDRKWPAPLAALPRQRALWLRAVSYRQLGQDDDYRDALAEIEGAAPKTALGKRARQLRGADDEPAKPTSRPGK